MGNKFGKANSEIYELTTLLQLSPFTIYIFQYLIEFPNVVIDDFI